MRTYASTPGRFRFNILTWGRCFPRDTALTLLPLLLVGISGVLYWVLDAPYQIAVILCWIGLITATPKLSFLSQKCRSGDANPAVVVSVSPCLIAVSADMTTRSGDAWPVIKILHQPLHRTRGPRPQVGDRLPTVALYRGFRAAPHWSEFFPDAVACLTDSPAAVREAMRRLEVNEFGPDHWQRLEQNLAQVPAPYRPGLYWMRSA